MLFRLPPEVLVLLIPVLLFALVFHEFSHAWVANKLGDPTARYRSEERRVGKECRSRWSPYH